MRILKFKVEKNVTDAKRLKEIDLTKKPLGSTVALVGKNGAGKSRILDLVKTYFQRLTIEDLFSDTISNMPQTLTMDFLAQITNAKTSIEQLKNTNDNHPNLSKLSKGLNEVQQKYFQRVQNFGQAYIKVVDNDDLKKIKVNVNNDTLSFENMLNNTHFSSIFNDPNPNAQQLQSVKSLNEFNSFNSQSTIVYLQDLANEIITDHISLFLDNTDKLDIIENEFKKKKSYKLFNNFQFYINQFLGKEFSYKQRRHGSVIDSQLYFDNHPFNIDLLSPGQKTLFAYAILFFYLDINSKTNIRDSIIIIDEPEKHLHPEAQIILIKALKNIVSNSGQLWIATHSVNIIPLLDYDEIVMVKDDEIILPSRTTPGNSFNDLMGLEEHATELVQFISSTSEWAYGNFMVQCFKHPEAVFNNDINDPQYRLFKEFISTKDHIILLDYGAGKGRIGYTINEDDEIKSLIDYNAYEPDENYYELLSKVPNKRMVYHKPEEIPNNSFDCILLCNVLHEINPNEWEEKFNQIKTKLNDDGYLLIIEDKFLPRGENANPFGYLILGSEQLKLLFQPIFSQDSEPLELTLQDEKYKDRIVFNVFTKDQINISENNIRKTIQSLNETSYNNIKLLRNEENKDVNHGRQYANQTQLYLNSKLALEALQKNSLIRNQ